MQTDFDIHIIRQHWIMDDDRYDKGDLCSHGEVYLRIADELIISEKDGSYTLSATALYLLRSLDKNCDYESFGSQIVPCCGNLLVPSSNNEDYVVICGCPFGFDWKIQHIDGNVLFTSENGTEGKLDFEAYRKMVIDFAKEVQLFYQPKLKVLPSDEFEFNGFTQFWNEWHALINKWSC